MEELEDDLRMVIQRFVEVWKGERVCLRVNADKSRDMVWVGGNWSVFQSLSTWDFV